MSGSSRQRRSGHKVWWAILILLIAAAVAAAVALSRRSPDRAGRVAAGLARRYGVPFGCTQVATVGFGDAEETMYWCSPQPPGHPVCAAWVETGAAAAPVLARARALLQHGQPSC